MPFLQINQKLHLNKPFHFQLSNNPTECKVETDNFQNQQYWISGTYKGEQEYVAFQKPDGDDFTYTKDTNLDLKASESLYKKIADFKAGDIIEVTLIPREKGGVLWNVVGTTENMIQVQDKPQNAPTTAVSTYQPNKSNALGITWGMCINNATKIVISWKADYQTLDFMRDDIEDIAFVLMDVATNGLKRWEQEQQEKDQNAKPMQEEPTEEPITESKVEVAPPISDEDLPF